MVNKKLIFSVLGPYITMISKKFQLSSFSDDILEIF